MRYEEALDFMFSRLPMFQRIGPAAYKADLTRTIRICAALGNPQSRYPGIHIAGTNGKGSVASLIAATLQSAGYRTGLFTSPHLLDYRERIRVNGQVISEDFVSGFVSEHQALFLETGPSFFEMTYSLAAAWFLEQGVDVVVWETGLGGRLDSTNIITPVLSVITNIGFDHEQFLGDTLPAIATEKAGIMKPGIPALIGQHQEETDPVFRERASGIGAPVSFSSDIVRVSFHDSGPLDTLLRFDVSRGSVPWMKEVESGLTGSYQRMNIPTALAAISLLGDLGFAVHDAAVRKGFREVRQLSGIAGRWLQLSEKPPVYCDTGHNSDGVRHVVSMLSQVRCRKLLIVFGTVGDKDPLPVLA